MIIAKKRPLLSFFHLGLFALLSVACNSPSSLQRSSLGTSSAKMDANAGVNLTMYHLSKDSSEIYFAINTSNLLYAKSMDKGLYEAHITISYKLLPDLDSKQIVDSGSVKVVDDRYSEGNFNLIGSFKIKNPLGQMGFVFLAVTDNNRSYTDNYILKIDKSSDQVRQNFLLLDSAAINPLFRNYVRSNETCALKMHAWKPSEKVLVRYYRRDFPLPPPPFSAGNNKPFVYAPDSVFSLRVGSDSLLRFKFSARGIYHFQNDTSLKDGFTIYKRDDESFPKIVSVEQMIPMMRYLTTRQEFEDVLYAAHKKKAFDDFWLRNAGSNERARQLVRSYYTRAQFSNNNFSSHVEGWKSDRGLIFTVFGEPNAIYRDANSETWIYGEEKSYRSLTFSFVRVINPFSDNDYMLSRSEMFKDEWYKSVDTWRQGRVFNDKP
jgi:GWxTD domain-containing protein